MYLLNKLKLVAAAAISLALTAACATSEKSPEGNGYYRHNDIFATIFWVGETSGPENGYIANLQSAWDSHWLEHYGGVDDPVNRQDEGLWPADFEPSENPFYFALPYNDLGENDTPKANVSQIYWHTEQSYSPDRPPLSLLKNRWVAVTYGDKTAYAQWQDVGPYESDDIDYVFGTDEPIYDKAGIDLSPATAHYLGIPGRAQVSWQFIAAEQVPSGPWTEKVTTRQVSR